jgi:hypothetical protein
VVLVVVVVVVVVLLLLLRVRIPQVHLPHLRPVPLSLSAVVASAPEHTHTQIAHPTKSHARCSPLLTTNGGFRDGINAQCWAVDWARFARVARGWVRKDAQ